MSFCMSSPTGARDGLRVTFFRLYFVIREENGYAIDSRVKTVFFFIKAFLRFYTMPVRSYRRGAFPQSLANPRATSIT